MSTNAKDFQQIERNVVSTCLVVGDLLLTVGVYKPYFTLSYNGEQLDYNHPYLLFRFPKCSGIKEIGFFLCDFYWNIKGHHGIYEQTVIRHSI